MNISDEINSFIRQLWLQGYRGTSDEANGMSRYDEAYLTGLLIKQTPYFMRPNICELDNEGNLLELLADYLSHNSIMSAAKLLEYITLNAIQLFLPEIKQLMDARKERDENYIREREKYKREMEEAARKTRG